MFPIHYHSSAHHSLSPQAPLTVLFNRLSLPPSKLAASQDDSIIQSCRQLPLSRRLRGRDTTSALFWYSAQDMGIPRQHDLGPRPGDNRLRS